MTCTFKALTERDKDQGIKVRVAVQSESDGRKHYNVVRKGRWMCSCRHWIFRKPRGGCKHIKAVLAAA